ncbi:MAG: extracellular solute-binding protein [Caldilineaceae bacterium]
MDRARSYLGWAALCWLHLFGVIPLILALHATPLYAQQASPLPSPETRPAGDSTGDDIGEVVTIRWFMRWDETHLQNLALPLIAAFEQQYPAIHVEVEGIENSGDYYRDLEKQLRRGAGPDVFYPATHVAYQLAGQGLLLPLASWLSADQVDLSAYDPAILALYADEQQQPYCLPIDTASLAIFYNKKLFDDAGVPYPTAPWRWADFLQVAQQMTRDVDHDGELDYYGVDRLYDLWPLFIWSWTGHALFDDPRHPTQLLLQEEQASAALQWLADLRLVHGVMPQADGQDKDGDLFLQGRAAMQITGHWRIPTYLAKGDLDFDFVPLPADEYVVNRSDGSCFAIAQNSAHAEAAWTFVKFLAGPGGLGARLLTEMQQITPVLHELEQADAFLQPLVLPGSNKAAFVPADVKRFPLYDPWPPYYAPWSEIAAEELKSLWSGARSATEVIARMTAAITPILSTSAPESTVPTGASSNPAKAKQPADAKPRPADPSIRAITITPRHLYVAPDGNDNNRGLSPLTPLATIQHALDIVQPGDTIHLGAGSYYETLTTSQDGRANAPITITGPPDAVVYGSEASNIALLLTNNYYTLVGFTFDGLRGDAADADSYTEILLYAKGTTVRRGVTGLHVLNMTFRNAGGECLRLRYFAQHNEIAYSTFAGCGAFDFVFAQGGKNGEAIYVGTSSNQWDDGKNPTNEPDQTSHNWIHHNTIDTQGNECVDIKEGAHDNLVEYNSCTGQLDPESAGLDARGDHNIFRYNVVFGNVGAGVRLGGHEVDGVQYGRNNQVYGNQLLGNVAGGVNIAVGPQSLICNNLLIANLGKITFGNQGDDYEPREPCPSKSPGS